MDDRIAQHEQKFLNILETIHDGYYEIDTQGIFKVVNRSLCEILGYSKEELLGRNYNEYVDAETFNGLRRVFEQVYRTGRPLRTVVGSISEKMGRRSSWSPPLY